MEGITDKNFGVSEGSSRTAFGESPGGTSGRSCDLARAAPLRCNNTCSWSQVIVRTRPSAQSAEHRSHAQELLHKCRLEDPALGVDKWHPFAAELEPRPLVVFQVCLSGYRVERQMPRYRAVRQ